jgi:UDP-N-acetylmuramoyl-tripeptide--D-alanyl-D-alanine ligase
MNITELYSLFLKHPSIETDTRKLKKGDLFFALKGPHFNGNEYAATALQQGASYCICDELTEPRNDQIIVVEDSLTALQQLAKHHRQQFNIPFIAITGSNGKTTTKELVSAVLATTYKTYSTQGNLNNHIGIPLTLLRIKTDAEIAVIEMGANHQKEIESYCTYTLPTHGIITNCGKAHLEGFGGEEGVRKGKGELFDFIRQAGGTVFVNTDYDYLLEMSTGVHTIPFGERNGDITGEVAEDDTFIQVCITKGASLPSVKTHLVGSYNLNNILTAVCVGKTFNVPDEKIKNALENYEPSNSRSQLIEKNGNKIILDAYNANPSSMKVAIENFAQMEGNKKILMLGGMMELGESSIKEHQEIVLLISTFTWFKVVLVGKDFVNLPQNFNHFANSSEAREWFIHQNFKDAQVLIKGSRSMEMEKIIE